MKGLQAVSAIAGVALVGVGAAMALTNPAQDTYEEYAVEQLTGYVQRDICPKAPSILGNSLQGQCNSIIQSHQSQIKQLISRSTQRQNFILFSIYKTDLSIRTIAPFLPQNVLPEYHFETVGAIDNFYTYQAQQR
ncbi:MAG TPA: DUF4359 domain-containing protein [Oculatellaceae cyanobacterium]|jgi:hypothetical protein